MASLVPFPVVALPQRVAWSASLPARIAPGDEGFDTLAAIGTAVDPADQVVVRSLRIDGQQAQGFLGRPQGDRGEASNLPATGRATGRGRGCQYVSITGGA